MIAYQIAQETTNSVGQIFRDTVCRVSKIFAQMEQREVERRAEWRGPGAKTTMVRLGLAHVPQRRHRQQIADFYEFGSGE